jgi:glycosyltransferase involved in cell wall biosynthesis
MHWTVLAPFNEKYTDSDWLSPYVPGNCHEFLFIPRPGKETNWHTKTVPVTNSNEWVDFWKQTDQAMAERQGGIITVFPQLAALAGLRQRMSGKRFPVLSWWLNTDAYTGVKGWIARAALESVDKFVVHTRCEAEYYSEWLGFPLDRFEFVPLQKPEFPRLGEEEQENPFIFSTGSGHRDYGTLFKAVEKLNIKMLVAPGRHAVAGLEVPSQVDIRFEITKPEIIKASQQARINVIPMTTEGPTGGTVTIVESMRMGCAIIATRRSGVEDYLEDGVTALLVDPHSEEQMTEAIERLWNDPELRKRLGKAAYDHAVKHCSDEAAGVHLERILNNLEDEYSSEEIYKVA